MMPDREDRLLNELWLEAMRKKGSAEMVLDGASMQPVIPKGSRIRIDTTLEAEAGRVACFLRNGRFFVHRVFLCVCTPLGRICVEGPEKYTNPAVFSERDYLGGVTAFRFPDEESADWLNVEDRAISLRERASALSCLLRFHFLSIGRILLNKVNGKV